MKTAENNKPTVAIVGAGVVGICTALEFVRNGYHVHLFDEHPPALQTSFGNAAYLAVEYLDPLASMGHIKSALQLTFSKRSAFKVTPDHSLSFLPWAARFIREAGAKRHAHNQLAMAHLNRQAIDAWRQTLAFADATDELRQSGFLRLWENPDHMKQARESQQQARDWGLEPELIQGEALAEKEPALSKRVHHALYFPESIHLGDTYQVCQRLMACFIQNGGTFIEQKVLAIKPLEHGAALSIQGKREVFDKTVVAAGAWSQQLLAGLGLNIPLAAERGYHLTLPAARGKLRHVLSSTDRNVVLSPLDCGLRIVGFGEFSRLNTPPVDKRYPILAHHLRQLLGDATLLEQEQQTWMGIRPTLPDSLPVIDSHPDYPQLGMVFGHQHLGVTHAAISAQLIQSLMNEGKSSASWRPFADLSEAYGLSRFA